MWPFMLEMCRADAPSLLPRRTRAKKRSRTNKQSNKGRKARGETKLPPRQSQQLHLGSFFPVYHKAVRAANMLYIFFILLWALAWVGLRSAKCPPLCIAIYGKVRNLRLERCLFRTVTFYATAPDSSYVVCVRTSTF